MAARTTVARLFDFTALPKGVQAKVLSYAVVASILDPKKDPYGYYDEDAGPSELEGLVEGLGWQGEYVCTLMLKASIRLGDAEIGSAKLTIVDRTHLTDSDEEEEEEDDEDDGRRGIGVSFHMACDAESQDLATVATTFFARDGRTPRLEAVKALGDEVRRGGVCYVDSFKIDDPRANDPTSDIAAEALAQLLGAAPLADKWTICVYIPEASAQMSSAEREAASSTGRMLEVEDLQTPEEQRADVLRNRAYVRRDAEPFLRVGFLQAEELIGRGNCPYLFAARSALRAEPLARSAAAKLRAAPLPPVGDQPSAADKELRRYLEMQFSRGGHYYDGVHESEYPAAQAELAENMRTIQEVKLANNSVHQSAQLAEHLQLVEELEAKVVARRDRFDAAEAAAEAQDASVAAEIRRHVDECGATVAGARALHIAAANHFRSKLIIDVIFELAADEDFVNWPDPDNSVAPLSVASNSILGKRTNQKAPPLDFIRDLLDRGANRAATDRNGLTAIGQLWESARFTRDFYCSVGITPNYAYDHAAFMREIEALIAPPGGPTPADEAARDEDEGDAAMKRQRTEEEE